MTVLFADLSGFIALSERIDPEDVHGFQGDFFGEMARAVERYEDFVEKFVGDAVTAVFGAPETRSWRRRAPSRAEGRPVSALSPGAGASASPRW